MIDLKGRTCTDNFNYGKPLDQYPVDIGRLRRVAEVVAEQSGWAKKKPSRGHGLGFAAHRSFLSYVAAVVEVEVDDKGGLRIPRVDVAVDAGPVVHPERVQAQFEGAAVFGASLALMGEITAAKGQIQQSNFNDYPVRGSTKRRARRTSPLCRATRCRQASANPVFRRLRRRSATRSSPRRASVSASCRSGAPSLCRIPG